MKKENLNPRHVSYIRSAAIVVVCGCLGAITGITVSHQWTHPSSLATVDVRRLIQEFVKSEARTPISPQQHQARVQAFSQALSQVLQEVAQEKHAILLPKEAILSGSVDFTATIEQRLKGSVTEATERPEHEDETE